MTFEEILGLVKNIKKGTINRVVYKSEVPLKAEYKKQGYKIVKFTENSVRIGVSYNNIKTVIERKSAPDYVAPKQRANNYEWVLDNRIAYNTNTHKNYLQIAKLPKHNNSKVRYLLVNPNGNSESSSSIKEEWKELIINSYFNPSKSSSGNEVKRIDINNVIRINNIKLAD